MLAPDYLQRKLQGWADTCASRNAAAKELAHAIGVSKQTALLWIEYRVERAQYLYAYRIFQFLREQEGIADV